MGNINHLTTYKSPYSIDRMPSNCFRTNATTKGEKIASPKRKIGLNAVQGTACTKDLFDYIFIGMRQLSQIFALSEFNVLFFVEGLMTN